MHRRRRSTSTSAVLLFALVLSLVLLHPTHNHTSSTSDSVYPANGFGGYQWDGRVTSTSSTFRVPTISANSTGDASTWIAADDGSFSHFIQLGVTEDSFSPGAAQYEAFWSDVAVGFHPHSLGLVRAGDPVSVLMTQNRSGWLLRFVNERNHLVVTKQINFGGAAVYRHGYWQQEDPTDSGIAAKDLPYPDMTTTRLTRLKVNHHVPKLLRDGGGILMASSGVIRIPTPERLDSFGFYAPTGVTAQFLMDQAVTDAGDAVFNARFAKWDNTPLVDRARFTHDLWTAYRGFAEELTAQQWPPFLRVDMARLVSSKRIEVRLLKQWAVTGYDSGADLFYQANSQNHTTVNIEDDIHRLLGVPPTQ